MLLTGLHAFSAPRGDGLRPELLTLLKECEAMQPGAKVTDIAAHRAGGFTQAGPNPARPISGPLPDDVLSFTPGPTIPSNDALQHDPERSHTFRIRSCAKTES